MQPPDFPDASSNCEIGSGTGPDPYKNLCKEKPCASVLLSGKGDDNEYYCVPYRGNWNEDDENVELGGNCFSSTDKGNWTGKWVPLEEDDPETGKKKVKCQLIEPVESGSIPSDESSSIF